MEMKVSSYDQWSHSHLCDNSVTIHSPQYNFLISSKLRQALIFYPTKKGKKPNRDWPELF